MVRRSVETKADYLRKQSVRSKLIMKEQSELEMRNLNKIEQFKLKQELLAGYPGMESSKENPLKKSPIRRERVPAVDESSIEEKLFNKAIGAYPVNKQTGQEKEKEAKCHDLVKRLRQEKKYRAKMLADKQKKIDEKLQAELAQRQKQKSEMERFKEMENEKRKIDVEMRVRERKAARERSYAEMI